MVSDQIDYVRIVERNNHIKEIVLVYNLYVISSEIQRNNSRARGPVCTSIFPLSCF